MSMSSSTLGTGRPASNARVDAARPAAPPTAAASAESLQKSGKRLIYAGFAITLLGVVSYCVVCFAAGASAELGDILLKNTVPFARATLGVLGLGTLVWVVGSFRYVRGIMDAADGGPPESSDMR